MMSNKENVVPPLADVSNLKKRPSPSTQTEVAFPPQKKKAQTFSDKTFDRGFESIVEFKKKNGHINIPYRCEENRPLGAFCAKVRKAQDELTQDQRDRLNSVGFCWETTQDRLWNEKYERLKQYHGKHGNCLVPTTYKEDRELSEWCSKQRAVSFAIDYWVLYLIPLLVILMYRQTYIITFLVLNTSLRNTRRADCRKIEWKN